MASGIYTLRQQSQAASQGFWQGATTPAVQYLVVAGGASGSYNGGGGGAGGLITGYLDVQSNTSYTVTVGAGGPTKSTSGNGNDGGFSEFGPIKAIGGGGGGSAGNAGLIGGSGGGGGSDSLTGNYGGPSYAGQGNAGGTATQLSNQNAAGGGGGAAKQGQSAQQNSSTVYFGGDGGQGIASDITGTRTAYAGGGGGSWNVALSSGGTYGFGGPGGGGNGATASGAGSAATVNTGGGGGGGSSGSGGGGGAGGSGIVVVSYPDIYPAATSTTGSPTISTSGAGSINFPTTGGTGSGSVASYIRYTGTSAFAVGTTGTYEFWINIDAFVSGVSCRPLSQGTVNGIDIYYSDTGVLGIAGGGTGGSATVTSSSLTTGSWIHVAIVINTNILTVYFNGVQQTLSGITTGWAVTGADLLSVSGYAPIIGQYGIDGKLADVRIVKNVAVYTGAFTPPTKPLQATQSAGTNISAITGTDTSLLLNGYSGAFGIDASSNSYAPVASSTGSNAPTWSSESPIATGLGYKNRVYKWTSSGSITF